jgi:hypothetical protein
MTLDLLIQAIVRQTTILIAQLATSRGSRAPLAQVASQVFLDLVRELERQGVSRKVSADMFGLGLRTYQRKIQRLTESSTDRGRSLWVAVLDFFPQRGRLTRAEVLRRFSGEDEALVRGVLHDLCETGLVTVSGTGPSIAYERTPDDELARLCQVSEDEGLDELVWALVYREGPLTIADVAARYGCSDKFKDKIEAALGRLQQVGRVDCSVTGGAFGARSLALPLGSAVGWEAAVFDHFQAVVNTITGRLRLERAATHLTDRVGGSTYTIEVWPGHPYEAAAYGALSALRSSLGDLREKVERYNAEREVPENHVQVSLYAGQCLIPQGSGDSDDDE